MILSNGTTTIHQLLLGYDWLLDPEAPLQADDVTEFAMFSSTYGFETIADVEKRNANTYVGKRAGMFNDPRYSDSNRCIVMRPRPKLPPQDTMNSTDHIKAWDKLMSRPPSEAARNIRAEAHVDFDAMYAMSPLSLQKKADKANVIALMKKVREAALAKLEGKVFTKLDLREAYEIGRTVPSAVKITAAIEDLSQQIDEIGRSRNDPNAVLETLRILKNGVEYLEQSYASALEQYMNTALAKPAVLIIGANHWRLGKKDLWIRTEELTKATYDGQGKQVVAYRYHRDDSHWMFTYIDSPLNDNDWESYVIHQVASPLDIAMSGGDPKANDFLKELIP